jgi:hypothetical protein
MVQIKYSARSAWTMRTLSWSKVPSQPPVVPSEAYRPKSEENRVLWFINVILACEVRGFEWSFGYFWLFRFDRRTVYRLDNIDATTTRLNPFLVHLTV